jgi:ribosomal protein L7/L12
MNRTWIGLASDLTSVDVVGKPYSNDAPIRQQFDSMLPKSGDNHIFTGLLLGAVIGVGMAAVLAWYVMKSPDPFVQKAPVGDRSSGVTERPVIKKAALNPKTPAADSQSANGRSRFDFYKELANKQDAATTTTSIDLDDTKAASEITLEDAKAVSEVAQILQVGLFSNVDDAEKLKSKLAMLGAEVNIQTAAIPDKGVWYRVCLGPYKNADELNKAKSFLKQNGLGSTPMRVQ